MSEEQPIAVFDSGAGGLAVLHALQLRLPGERFVYFADQAHFPYGERAPEEVRDLTLAAAERLERERAIKLLVVACNTASAAALPELRRRFAFPVVGIEPAIKPARALTRSGCIGVLATRATAAAGTLRDLIARVAADVRVVVRPAPRLVAEVEAGLPDPARADALLEAELRPLQAAGADVLVMGCTHFAFVRERARRLLGGVPVLEPAEAVARRAADLLRERGLATAGGRGAVTLLTSGDPARLEALAGRLLPLLA
jgi:glutamate racemase